MRDEKSLPTPSDIDNILSENYVLKKSLTFSHHQEYFRNQTTYDYGSSTRHHSLHQISDKRSPIDDNQKGCFST